MTYLKNSTSNFIGLQPDVPEDLTVHINTSSSKVVREVNLFGLRFRLSLYIVNWLVAWQFNSKLFATQALSQTTIHRSLLSVIWILVAQWLEHLTGNQKIAGSIPVWDCDKTWLYSKHFTKIKFIFVKRNVVLVWRLYRSSIWLTVPFGSQKEAKRKIFSKGR